MTWGFADTLKAYLDEQWASTFQDWEDHPEYVVLLMLLFGLFMSVTAGLTMMLYRHFQQMPKKLRNRWDYIWILIAAVAVGFAIAFLYFTVNTIDILHHEMNRRFAGTFADWEQHGEYVFFIVLGITAGVTGLCILAYQNWHHIRKAMAEEKREREHKERQQKRAEKQQKRAEQTVAEAKRRRTS
jgi:heme exporter protein D